MGFSPDQVDAHEMGQLTERPRTDIDIRSRNMGIILILSVALWALIIFAVKAIL